MSNLKIYIIISLLILFVISLALGYHFYTVNSLTTQIIELQDELSKTKEALQKQNDEIEKTKIPETVESSIKEYNKELDKDTKITIDRIDEELNKNPTEQKQLEVIESLLKDFANE